MDTKAKFYVFCGLGMWHVMDEKGFCVSFDNEGGAQFFAQLMNMLHKSLGFVA